MAKLNKEVGVSEDQMKSLMMPFSNNNGAMQFGNSGQNMGFINSKVFKPIRGGGARAPATDTSNYDS